MTCQVITLLYYYVYVISFITMESNPAGFGDLSGNYCMFYRAQALLNHNTEKEFGTVIAQSKNRVIIVDDEISRKHVGIADRPKQYKNVKMKLVENMWRSNINKILK